MTRLSTSDHRVGYIGGSLALLGLFLSYLFGPYLLFHSLSEMFSILVAGGIFMIAWNARRFLENDYLFFLGTAYGSVAFLDLLHLFAYKGMGVFPGHDANLPTQLWITARYLQSLSLAAAPFYRRERMPPETLAAVYLAVTAGLTAAVFYPGFFPDCYVEGKGLTSFKVVSEYVISAVFLAALGLFLRRRAEFDPAVRRWLSGSIILSVGAELAFSNYINVYGPANMAGHLMKIGAFYLFYKAIIETGLVKPYALLFRSLKMSEEATRRENAALVSLQRELASRNAELAIKNEELTRLNDQKNHFVGMAAHDLRSPLSVITWFSEALIEKAQRDGSSPDIDPLLIIKRSSGFMLNLVNNLLDISKIEAGRINLDTTPTDLVDLVARNVHLNRILAERKGIELVFSPRGAIPPVLVDPHRIEQVLNNLISNAIKYSHAQTMVEVSLHGDDGTVHLSVRDQGQGIPAEEFNHLFQPFRRTSVRGTAGEKSTGLGLTVVRKIVEAHGGSIGVASVVGEGSTFTVSLPRGADADDSPGSPALSGARNRDG
jgi:signal transduction histidine kinase